MVLLLAILFNLTSLFSMDSQERLPSVKETTTTYVQWVSPELKQSIDTWLKNNPTLKEKLLEQPGDLLDYSKKWKAGLQELENHHIENKSHNNFVFVYPENPAYIFKISGPVSRYCLKISEKELERIRHSPAKLDAAGCADVKTYQTFSEVFNAMSLASAIKFEQLDCLSFNNIAHYSTSDKQGIESLQDNEDEQCIAVIDRNDVMQKIDWKNQDSLNEIFHKKALDQVLKVTSMVGLWALANKIHYDPTTQKIVITDLEQPDTTKLNQMYQQDPGRHAFNATCGIKTLLESFPKYSQQRQQILEFAQQNKVISSAYNFDYDIKPYINGEK